MLGHYHRRCHNVGEALAKLSHCFAYTVIWLDVPRPDSVAREARVSRWSGVPNRSTQVHIWQGVVGNTPCNARMLMADDSTLLRCIDQPMWLCK